MGCRTGFYFLVRNMEPEVAIKLVNDMLAFIASFEGDVPGATEKECGNFREQDLEGAKAIARKMIPVLKAGRPPTAPTKNSQRSTCSGLKGHASAARNPALAGRSARLERALPLFID